MVVRHHRTRVRHDIGIMQLLLCVLSSVHLAACVFFHEKSPIDLAPTPDANNSDFGFSLAYQKGKNANLLVGAPLYDLTGRVYQCPLDDIRHEKNTCKPLHIDFDAMGVRYNRSLSKQQHFYLGASIAATEKFFVTCAPLRTDFHFMRSNDVKMYYGAYGICFYYDPAGAHTCNGHGLERDAKRNISLQNEIYGGAGWTTLVDEPHDRILITKSFASGTSGDIIGGSSSQPESDYFSFVRKNLIKKEKGTMSYGQALTVGNYFDTDAKATFYAVSFKGVTAQGGIDFFNSSSLKLRYTLNDQTVGSMFGEALCSADVTGDGRAELFVGAPALATDARSYDRGAVHVYSKSDKPLEMVMKLTVIGDKDGARFGSTLATNDVDGDSYPEIFVSAVSENFGAGALYVLCGFEIHESILNSPSPYITISELKRTQRIEKKSYTGFGFSLQPVPDFNDNGSDELSVSAPDNSTVSLYRGVRAITVKVTSRFADANDKSESTNEYTFQSCVAIDLPPKPTKITTKLLVKNVISGKGASIKNVSDARYQIDLATEKGVKNIYNNTEYCRNLSMIIPSSCKVTTEVSLVDNIQDYKKFDSTWVSLSAQSKLKNEVQMTCRCNDTTCAPNLTVQLSWSGRDRTKYVVGTTRSEKVTLLVHNNGTTGCDTYIRVGVKGALVEKLQCQLEEIDYVCTLPSPFRPNTTQQIEVLLLMDKITNQDKEFVIEVLVDKAFRSSEAEPYSTILVVPYEFNADLLVINGSVMNRNISDTELSDATEEIITDEQTYTIVNNRSITWKNVLAKISADKKPFIQRFTVSSTQADKCDEYNGTDRFSSACLVTLAPNSTVKLILTTTIRKKEIANYFKDWKITIDSELVLELSSNMSKSKSLTTTMMFEKEQTVGRNRSLVLIIAIVVALLLLLIITFILYKLNFFKRKNKEELQVLKREIQKRSVRGKSSPAQGAQNRADSQLTNMDDIVIVDEPFEPIPASDVQPGTSALAEETAQDNHIIVKNID